MKIHQRLYSVRPPRPLAPPSATAAVASSSSAPRVRSNSASSPSSSSRGLHTLPLSFFDGPPTPPSSRPSSTNLVVSSRLAVEAKPEFESHSTNSPYSHPSQNSSQSQSNPSGHGPPPYPLAFTSSQSDASPSHFHSYSSHNIFFPYPALGPFPTLESVPQPLVDQPEQTPSATQRTRYHLDVGAYGIPKHSRDPRSSTDSRSSLPLHSGAQILSQDSRGSAVLVGEDAYFVRDNAMGVADGVGGWSKVNKNARVDGNSPSALFAQRLMSYCYEEVDAAMTSSSDPSSSSLEREREQLEDQLEDSLEDLSEGLDVLMILERAYDKTMKVHTSAAHASSGQSSSSGANKSDVGSMSERDKHRFVRKEGEGKGMRCEDTRSPVDPRSRSSPGAASSSSALSSPGPSKSSFSPSSPLSSSTSASGSSVPSSSKSNVKQHPQQSHSRTRNPMLQGSATALLAVLDHPSSPPASGVTQCASAPRSYFASSSSSSSLFAPKPRYPTPIPPLLNSNWYWAGKQDTKRDCPVVSQQPEVKDHGAVVRIAHLGDCMGMLIRGEEVVWRTEEMWWNFNTPVQLGPLSSTRPQDAKVFTIPVQADDILVLASDGLSDNLWDEDILDEVVRFKRSFMPPSDSSSPASSSSSSSGVAKEGILGRRTLAGMLSEALCSRARAVSERRGKSSSTTAAAMRVSASAPSEGPAGILSGEEDEVPFARRAREQGRAFRGGKLDDISVLIAVVSPVETAKIASSSS
ncbi:hypothetical protein NLI96_g8609 [Meripilus lineatus]|uniref:Protein phosphatase n=1 Tax=Meripilus lineatus TaxID=2056292 RepID=A0AAD5V1N1_9APHY|nr:hypothetical protein NLI96_g8609 [Physisporinus lineatus]